MKAKTIACVILAAGLAAAPAAGQDTARRKARLEAEIELAKTPNVYLVVDSEAREVSLRIRGMALKTWSVASLRSWGRPVGVRSLKLVKRTGWSAEDRVNLTPGVKPEEKEDGKPKDIGDDVLELEDMPFRYAFLMEEGVRIVVRPKPRGLLGKMGGVAAGLGRLIGRSAQTIWAAVKGREFSEIKLVFVNQEDAQAMFWSTPEGTKILFL